MTKYAQFDKTAAQPTPVIGWYDTDFAEYTLPDASELIELDDAAWENRFNTPYVGNGKLVVKPAPSDSELLAQAKKDKKKEIETARDAWGARIIVVDGISYDADRTSQLNITSMATAIANGVAPATIDWRDADNITRSLTNTEFMAVAQAVMAQVLAAYTTSFSLKDQLNSTTTVAEVDAIVWPAS